MRRAALAIVVTMLAAGGAGASDDAFVECEMEFSLEGWSAFYTTVSGTGEITCSNGQSAEAELEARGGGLTFGTSKIDEGIGTFSDVSHISECFGTYVQGEAHAGAVKSAKASVMTKGVVSLALAGKGRGVDLGVAFGAFTVSEAGEDEDEDDGSDEAAE